MRCLLGACRYSLRPAHPGYISRQGLPPGTVLAPLGPLQGVACVLLCRRCACARPVPGVLLVLRLLLVSKVLLLLLVMVVEVLLLLLAVVVGVVVVVVVVVLLLLMHEPHRPVQAWLLCILMEVVARVFVVLQPLPLLPLPLLLLPQQLRLLVGLVMLAQRLLSLLQALQKVTIWALLRHF